MGARRGGRGVRLRPTPVIWGEGARIAFLAALVAGGIALYGLLAVISGAVRPAELRAALTRTRPASPPPAA